MNNTEKTNGEITLSDAANILDAEGFGDPAHKVETPREDAGYTSLSTIDNPPTDVPDDDDKDDFTKPRTSDLFQGERLFEVEYSVTLRPVEGKAIKVPLLADKIRGTLVEESLAIALTDPRTRNIIAAILDNPRDRVRGPDADEPKSPQLTII